jgi:hypothetical protein
MYSKMTSGLMNVGETLQCAMDIAFIGEKDKFLVIYLDDITLFSNYDQEHYQDLEKVFLKCKKYSLPLNPKKSIFSMKESC